MLIYFRRYPYFVQVLCVFALDISFRWLTLIKFLKIVSRIGSMGFTSFFSRSSPFIPPSYFGTISPRPYLLQTALDSYKYNVDPSLLSPIHGHIICVMCWFHIPYCKCYFTSIKLTHTRNWIPSTSLGTVAISWNPFLQVNGLSKLSIIICLRISTLWGAQFHCAYLWENCLNGHIWPEITLCCTPIHN